MANYIFTRLKIFLSNPIKTIERLKQVELYAQEYQEIFIVQPYFWLFNLVRPGTTIVDIGATIGDTSIYFAMNPNVSRVIAYEPNVSLFREAEENVGKSPFPLRQKITLHKAQIGNYEEWGGWIGTTDRNETNKTEHSLDQALRLLDNVAIKCDVEGAEINIFNERTDLSKVYAIQMEYHHGRSAQLIATLRNKGFLTKSEHTENRSDLGEIGHICAWK
jgi:FkbM family methyltransferase